MSYHKFSNFGEKLNSDLNATVNARLEDTSVNEIWTVCAKSGAKEATVTVPMEAAADSNGCLQPTLQMLWESLCRKDAESPQEKN
jgi:hypothetical protein